MALTLEEMDQDLATATDLHPIFRHAGIAVVIRNRNPDRVERVREFLDGSKYGSGPLTDFDQLAGHMKLAIFESDFGVAAVLAEHFAKVCREFSERLVFRQLDRTHARAVYNIEQAIRNKQPDSEELGHMHCKTLEAYEQLLSPQSQSKFVGAFIGERLVAYGAYIIPENPRALHQYDEQLVSVEEKRRISIPVSENSVGTGIYYLLRVDPDCQFRGVGTRLNATRIQESLGTGDGLAQDHKKGADFMLGDITATNWGSLKAHSAAGEKEGVTTLIWAAGYDEGAVGNAKYAPCITIMQTTAVTYEDVPTLCSIGAKEAFGESFAAFAKILDAGYVAKIDCGGRDTNLWQIHIAARPEKLREVRAENEPAAEKIEVGELAALLARPQERSTVLPFSRPTPPAP